MPEIFPFAEGTTAAALQATLLGREPYSASDPVRLHTLGVALERQRGVHAIGTDRRQDYDTWPGTLAYTPPGVDVFSESETGGEYLVVRWSGAPGMPAVTAQRLQWTGHAPAVHAAQRLRRLLVAPVPDALAIEQAAWDFIGILDTTSPLAPGDLCGQDMNAASPPSPQLMQRMQPTQRTDEALRATYSRVLDRIASDFASPLSLAELAQAEGRTPLRFVREFTRLVGMTPHAFIVETRLQAARAMLRRADAAPLAEIAADCGFAHQSHMGAAFRKWLHQTPGQYTAAGPADAPPA